MNTLYFIFFILFLFLIIVLKKLNIKKYHIVNIITILIFLFLYCMPLICIKIFVIFCNYYDSQLSSYAFAVWYFIIYIVISIARFILLFGIALYGLYKAKDKVLIFRKYNSIILLSTLILDFIIYKFFVQNGIIYDLSQNNIILYGLFYSITVIYLPILTACSFISFVDFIKNRKS